MLIKSLNDTRMESPLTSKPSKLSKAPLAIDWNQLSQLSEGNQEFEVELIKLFFVETKTLLTLLADAIDLQDMRQVEYIAHQIKGSSGNIGFRAMSQIAGQLEQQARQQNLNLASSLLQALTQWILEIQDFLEW
jgi:HPt (histidine-containing phosphotransfer) domain-containing protein